MMKQWTVSLPKGDPADGKSHFVLAVKDARGHRLEFKGQIDAKVAAEMVQMVVAAAGEVPTASAGRIYALAAAYHAAEGMDGSHPELATEAASWARAQLNSMGLDPLQLNSAQACIAAAAQFQKTKPLTPGD